MSDMKYMDKEQILYDLGYLKCMIISKNWEFIEAHEKEFEEALETADMFLKTPPVDAIPVVHGRWIKHEGFITEYECSVCQHSDSKLTAIRGHYYWYCGAKMDGEMEK